MKRKYWILMACALLIGLGAAAVATPAESGQDLTTLATQWKAHGLDVLDVTADSADPRSVTVRVRLEDVLGPGSMERAHELERRPALLRQAGVEVRYLTVVGVDQSGKESMLTKFLVDDRLPASTWDPATMLAESEARATVEELIQKAASTVGIESRSTEWVINEDGRMLRLEITVPIGGNDQMGRLVDQVGAGIRNLNSTTGKAVTIMIVTVVDTEGKLLLKELDDFQLALGTRAGYVEPDYRKVGYQPSFMD